MADGELYGLVIFHDPDTADCRCKGCEFTEHARGITQVHALRGHAAEHVLVTGHEVQEVETGAQTFSPA